MEVLRRICGERRYGQLHAKTDGEALQKAGATAFWNLLRSGGIAALPGYRRSPPPTQIVQFVWWATPTPPPAQQMLQELRIVVESSLHKLQHLGAPILAAVRAA